MPEASYLRLGRIAETSELRVSEARLLHLAELRGVRLRPRLGRRQQLAMLGAGEATEAVRRLDDLGELVQEPGVDAGE